MTRVTLFCTDVVDVRMAGLGLRYWEMAHALVAEAYQREQELIVMRGGVKMALPEGRVLDDPTALANQVTVAPTPSTQPIKAAQDDRTVPKELGPLRGIIR